MNSIFYKNKNLGVGKIGLNSYYLNFLLFFKNYKKWSGGGSGGKKVFRGQVGGNLTGKKFLKINYFNSLFFNMKGILQFFFSVFGVHNVLGLIFYPGFGFFSLQLIEQTNFVSTYIYSLSTKINKNCFGSTYFLKNFNVGMLLYSLQLGGFCKARIIRSGGCFGKILKLTEVTAYIKFPSSLIYLVDVTCVANFGIVKKDELKNNKLYNAGSSGLYGSISKVGGVAMNPVDHPHGGGTKGGFHPTNSNGKIKKGMGTRGPIKWSNFLIFKYGTGRFEKEKIRL